MKSKRANKSSIELDSATVPRSDDKDQEIYNYSVSFLFIVCSINLFIQINSTIVFGQKIIGRKCSPLKFTESDRVPITDATRNTQ